MKIKLSHTYNDIIKLENLLLAWQEFIIGKKNKKDVQEFSHCLMDNILDLQKDLENKIYCHGGYTDFYINDPKRRHIHKACVRDRLLHHAIYRILYPFFDKTFIHDSYSCRISKGVYKAIDRFDNFALKLSKNNTQTVYVLKCDIRKFFDTIDHQVLFNILDEYIPDKNIIWLLNNVINSYHNKKQKGVGLPLGNLTSQLFANVYMNIFDQWVKHKLKAKYYIRYADDFVFLDTNKYKLSALIEPVRNFLLDEPNLTLPPNKITQKSFYSGIDFLGWVHFPHYKKLRKKTKTRMFRRLVTNPTEETFQSYLGLLSHGNTWGTEKELRNLYWLLK